MSDLSGRTGLIVGVANKRSLAWAIAQAADAAGARLVLTVAKELRRSNTRYALATQCIGAGMGISTILERLD